MMLKQVVMQYMFGTPEMVDAPPLTCCSLAGEVMRRFYQSYSVKQARTPTDHYQYVPPKSICKNRCRTWLAFRRS